MELIDDDLVMRDATEADIPAIKALYENKELMKFFNAAAGELMKQTLAKTIQSRTSLNRRKYLLVKEVKGEFAGISLLELDLSNNAALSGINVPEHQSRGVSTRALKLMEKLAKSLDIQMIRATVHKDHKVVQKLLTSGGFTKAVTAPTWITYEKELKNGSE